MIRLNKILVVDIEMTCWADKTPPPGEVMEIIEIGIATYDRTNGVVSDKRSFPVRPERSGISEFCTELTGWTWKDLAKAPPLEGALGQIRDTYGPKSKIWASWGEGDRLFLEMVCNARRLTNPFSNRHLNIKSLFALLSGIKEEMGLAKALEMAGVEPEGRAHNGADDAWNTARLLHKLLEDRSVFAGALVA
jgi:inhibitor of KinA sporulation pathway (predicted exonuclease)